MSTDINSTQGDEYGASEITVLEGLEAVRKRPGMYIGNTGKDGLHRGIGEILDNCVDEFMAGHATEIRMKVKNGTIYIGDDGRGIPTAIHPKTGKSTVETIMTVLHAGGKFDQKSYQFSGGLHGVGASVVNALSNLLQVWVLRDGVYKHISFAKGKVKDELSDYNSKEELVAKFPEIESVICWTKTGTIVSFEIDDTIFETTEYDLKWIYDDLKDKAYLNQGLKINLQTHEDKHSADFCFPEGIKTYLEDLTAKEKLITPIITFNGEAENFHLSAALAYGEDYNEKLFAFTNGIANPEGGAHVTGLKGAITKLINNYATTKGYFKKEEKFTPDDLREGMRIVLSIKMADPQFTSQSKVKLGSTIARTLTLKII